MKKLLPIIMYALLITAVALLTMLMLPGCSKKQYQAIQTQIHDLRNEVKEQVKQAKALESFNEDCYIERVTFGRDSFAWYTVCPNSAKPIRKLIIQKSYPLTHAD